MLKVVDKHGLMHNIATQPQTFHAVQPQGKAHALSPAFGVGLSFTTVPDTGALR